MWPHANQVVPAAAGAFLPAALPHPFLHTPPHLLIMRSLRRRTCVPMSSSSASSTRWGRDLSSATACMQLEEQQGDMDMPVNPQHCSMQRRVCKPESTWTTCQSPFLQAGLRPKPFLPLALPHSPEAGLGSLQLGVVQPVMVHTTQLPGAVLHRPERVAAHERLAATGSVADLCEGEYEKGSRGEIRGGSEGKSEGEVEGRLEGDQRGEVEG